MSFVKIRYEGVEAQAIHWLAGPDMEHPERRDRIVWQRGVEVTISSPPEDAALVQRLRELCLHNPESWVLVAEG